MLQYLQKQSRTWLQALGFSLIALLAVIDYLTGPQLSFSIFYLLPISMLGWFVDRRTGILASIVGGVCWLVADLLGGQTYQHLAVPYWNAGVRLGFFLIVTFALSTIREAQDREAELQQFIVHDLRAPLSNMMTGLQLLQEMAAESQDEDYARLVGMSQVSANRMLVLINGLLDLARLERGQLPLQPRTVDVEEVLRHSIQDVGLWARQKDLALVVDNHAGQEAAWADPDVAGRVLANLLGNAIKFSPTGGTVTLAVHRRGPGELAISVADEGDGVPASWTRRVFDKYAQVDARRRKEAGGFGLGLAFCRLAVESHGGHIWLESAEGAGTTVTFTLPVSPEGRPAHSPRVAAAGRLAS